MIRNVLIAAFVLIVFFLISRNSVAKHARIEEQFTVTKTKHATDQKTSAFSSSIDELLQTELATKRRDSLPYFCGFGCVHSCIDSDALRNGKEGPLKRTRLLQAEVRIVYWVAVYSAHRHRVLLRNNDVDTSEPVLVPVRAAVDGARTVSSSRDLLHMMNADPMLEQFPSLILNTQPRLSELISPTTKIDWALVHSVLSTVHANRGDMVPIKQFIADSLSLLSDAAARRCSGMRHYVQHALSQGAGCYWRSLARQVLDQPVATIVDGAPPSDDLVPCLDAANYDAADRKDAPPLQTLYRMLRIPAFAQAP